MPFAFQNAPKPLLEAHSVTAHHLVAVVAAIRRCLASLCSWHPCEVDVLCPFAGE